MRAQSTQCVARTRSGRRCTRRAMYGSDLCGLHRLLTAQGIAACLGVIGMSLIPILAFVNSLRQSPAPDAGATLRISHLLAYDDCTLDLMQQGRLAQACALEGSPILLGNEVAQYWRYLHDQVWQPRPVDDTHDEYDGPSVPRVVRKVRLNAESFWDDYSLSRDLADPTALLKQYQEGLGQPGFYGEVPPIGCARYRTFTASELADAHWLEDPLSRALAAANPTCDDLVIAECEWGCGGGPGDPDENGNPYPPDYEVLHVRPMRMAFLRVENIGQTVADEITLRVRKLQCPPPDRFKLRMAGAGMEALSDGPEEEIPWKSLAPGEQLLIPLGTSLDLPGSDGRWLEDDGSDYSGADMPNWMLLGGESEELRYDTPAGTLLPEYADEVGTTMATGTCPVSTRYEFGPAWAVNSIAFKVASGRQASEPVPSLDRCRLARVGEYVEQGGCCPLVSVPCGPEFHVLDRCEGAARARWEVHVLPGGGDNQIVIREKQDEESYLDAVWLLAPAADGGAVQLRPQVIELQKADGIPYHLPAGGCLRLSFDTGGLPPGPRSLKIRGYYQKLQVSALRMCSSLVRRVLRACHDSALHCEPRMPARNPSILVHDLVPVEEQVARTLYGIVSEKALDIDSRIGDLRERGAFVCVSL